MTKMFNFWPFNISRKKREVRDRHYQEFMARAEEKRMRKREKFANDAARRAEGNRIVASRSLGDSPVDC